MIIIGATPESDEESDQPALMLRSSSTMSMRIHEWMEEKHQFLLHSVQHILILNTSA